VAAATRAADDARMSTDTAIAIPTLRPATLEDAEACGQTFFEAFRSIAERHAFPIEPGSPEFTRMKAGMLLADPEVHAVVAERDGRVVAAAFADERDAIVGLGPVVVAPGEQDATLGRRLMEQLLQREEERGAPGVRLVQTAYHLRSLALYAKLGFVVREPLAVVSGSPPRAAVPAGIDVRPAAEADLEACCTLCRGVHGHDRRGEVVAAIADGTARVALRDGRVTAYATGAGYGWHAVAEANDGLCALLGTAEAYLGLGVLVPARNAPLLRWCLENGLRIVQTSTLMSIGLYDEPAGAWLPSILY
jgi:predicted N-acetyltransferase YhbS